MKNLLLGLFIILFIAVIVFLIVKCFKNQSNFSSTNLILEPIPKVIHKVIIEHSGDLPKFPLEPKELQEAHDSWKKMNPEYEIKYYSMNDCREYLKKHFEDSYFLQAFDCLNAYAFKCDFFRYCVLYNEGGWYSDWKQVCLKKNLLNELDNNKKGDIILFEDLDANDKEYKTYIQNNFIGAIKNNLFLKESINEIINNIKYKRYFKNSPRGLMITGPGHLRNIYKIRNFSFKLEGHYKNNKLYTSLNKLIIIHKFNKHDNQTWSKGNNYIELWKSKNIYKDFKIKDKIPKIIHKTGPQKFNNLSTELLKIFDGLEFNNPGFKIKYYDNDDCYNLIKNNFGEEVLWAYNRLIPTAYKADLFRYCVLYLYGGIYSDLSQNFLISLNDIINYDNDTLILTEDFIHEGYSYPGIQISFIACIPKLKIFKLCIDNIIYNCKILYYGHTPLDVTGPYLFKHTLNNYNINYIIKLYQSNGFLINYNKQKIIKTKSNNHNKILYNKNNTHYYYLWKRREIYNNITKISYDELVHYCNKSLFFKKFGYFIFHDGNLLKEDNGDDNIQIWTGGCRKSFIKIYKEISFLIPSKFLLCSKCDTGFDRKDLAYNGIYDEKYLHNYDNLLIYSFYDYNYKKYKNLKPYYLYFTKNLFNSTKNNFKLINFNDKIHKVIWRGQTSGIYNIKNKFIGTRLNIVRNLHNFNKSDVGFTSNHYDDIFLNEFNFKLVNKISENDQNNYKIILIIDGWGWPGNLKWGLESNSLIIIVSKYYFKFLDNFKENTDYIRANLDGSDILQKVQYYLNFDEKQYNDIVYSRLEKCKKVFNKDFLKKEFIKFSI